MTRLHRDTFPQLPAGTTTNWGSPYALVARGGRTPGKRPATSLAFITRATSNDGGHTLQMRALIRRGDGWSKPRQLEYEDIVASWRNPPSSATVIRCRNGMDRIPA